MIIDRLSSLRWKFSRRYHTELKRKKLKNCRNEPKLFEIQWVDPKEIYEFTRRPVPFWRRKWKDHGQIKCGEWDIRDEHSFEQNYDKDWYLTQRPTVKYEDSIFHQSMVERYIEHHPWEETKQFKISKERIKSGESTWDGCESICDLLKKGRYIDKLYNEISTQGYKPQASIQNKFKSAIKNEITVDIGRDGSYLFVDGRHRLSIAKILDLNLIPIQVCTVHQLTQDSPIE